MCRACMAAVGTAAHRIRDCPAPHVVAARQACGGPWRMRVEQGCGTALWERGLAAAPDAQWRWLPAEEALTLDRGPAEGLTAFESFTGDVIVDGSRRGWPGRWASCGWAALQLGDGDTTGTSLSSPLAAVLPPHRTIKRADMVRVLEVLRRGSRP